MLLQRPRTGTARHERERHGDDARTGGAQLGEQGPVGIRRRAARSSCRSATTGGSERYFRSRSRVRRGPLARRERSAIRRRDPDRCKARPHVTTSAPEAAWARTSVASSSGAATSSSSRKTTQGAVPASRPACRAPSIDGRSLCTISGPPARSPETSPALVATATVMLKLAVALGGERRKAALEPRSRLRGGRPPRPPAAAR